MNRFLTARTPLGEALWVVSLSGREALSALYAFELEFRSEARDLDGQAMIGEVCAVRLETDGGAERWLAGKMVSFSATGFDGRHWCYQATVAPRLWHASRRSDMRIWQHQSVQEIVTRVLDENAVRFEWRLKQKYKTWRYVCQYKETDLNFILRQLEHEGIFFWFEHGVGGDTLVLADHFTCHRPFPGYERVPFYLSPDARATEDHFSGWRLTREVEPGTYRHSDYDFKHPGRDLTTRFSDPRGHLFDQYERFDYPGDYTEPPDGENYAANALERLQVGRSIASYSKRLFASCVSMMRAVVLWTTIIPMPVAKGLRINMGQMIGRITRSMTREESGMPGGRRSRTPCATRLRKQQRRSGMLFLGDIALFVMQRVR